MKPAKSIQRYELVQRRETLRLEDAPVYAAPVTSPDEAARIARILIGDRAQESILVFHLNRRNRIIGYSEAARGGMFEVSCAPADIFRAALVAGACSIILAHNHPSGDPTPSTADVQFTARLQAAGEIIGMPILDHVIVTDSSSASLRELGMMRGQP